MRLKCTGFSCQLQVSAARVSHFLNAETCVNFREFPRIPWQINVQQILQMVKSRTWQFCPPNPRKSTVYTCPSYCPSFHTIVASEWLTPSGRMLAKLCSCSVRSSTWARDYKRFLSMSRLSMLNSQSVLRNDLTLYALACLRFVLSSVFLYCLGPL